MLVVQELLTKLNVGAYKTRDLPASERNNIAGVTAVEFYFGGNVDCAKLKDIIVL